MRFSSTGSGEAAERVAEGLLTLGAPDGMTYERGLAVPGAVCAQLADSSGRLAGPTA
ncbi:hypothetical protein [Streptomyces buecherae]|uniref:Uncharacterized protein n=1 Tax=Streptomyces buecherae TaxID=2763006 RepID=A0A7H8NEP8_9ACTN|nr:hypothetical protein [Streptomyces buecherae]QKW52960.1 hypothetical protein HUT08_29285 [Streptomyces buecherae]